MATNVIPDPSLEGGTPFTGYFLAGGVALTQITGTADNGTKYGLATITGTGGKKWATAPSLTGLITGDIVSVGAAVSDSSDSSNIAVGIRWLATDGTTVILDDVPARSLPGTGWSGSRRIWSNRSCPAGATKAALLYDTATGLTGRTFKFDSEVLIKQDYSGGYIGFGVAPGAPESASGANWIVFKVDDVAYRDFVRVKEFTDAAARGITLSKWNFPDPSCSPERAAFMTSQYPLHNGVTGVDGSTAVWRANGLENVSIAKYLTDGGVRAHIWGKFLHDIPMDGSWHPNWTTAYIANTGYTQYSVQTLTWNGSTTTIATTSQVEDQYLTDKIKAKVVAEINNHVTNFPASVLFGYVALFNNHDNHGDDMITGPTSPAVSAAPRDRPTPTGAEVAKWTTLGWTLPPLASGNCDPDDPTGGCTLINFFDDPSAPHNNVQMLFPPEWFPVSAMGAGPIADGVEHLRDRVRALRSAGECLTAIFDALVANGIDDNTYVVICSDNGYHIGEQTLRKGKATWLPFDIECPAIIVPPSGLGSPRVADDLVTSADLLPTIMEAMSLTRPDGFDGRSMMDIINNVGGRAKRKRLPQVFRDDHSYDDRIDSGQPPSWDMVHGISADGHEYQFGSHEPGAILPPPNAKGFFFDRTVDPYCMINRYAELSDASKIALMAALVSVRDATGSAARTNALLALPNAEYTVSTPGATRKLKIKVNGIDIFTLAMDMEDFGSMMTIPPRIGENEEMPGNDGRMWVGDKRFDENEFDMHMWVRGCNPDGSLPADPANARLVRDHMGELMALFNVDVRDATDGRSEMIIEYPDGVVRAAYVEFKNEINFLTSARGNLAKFVITVVNPDAFWRTVTRIDSAPILYAFGSSSTGIIKIPTHEGCTASIQGALIILRNAQPGPIKISDGSSSTGTGVKYMLSLAAGERLEINSNTWECRWYANAADNVGEDHSDYLFRLDGWGRWLRFQPSPNNRRINVELDLGGVPAADASIQFLAPMAFINA